MGIDELVGKTVRITVDVAESGDQGPLNIIRGTIRGSVRDVKGVLYHVIDLHEVVDPSDVSPAVFESGEEEGPLLVAPKLLGDSLLSAFREKAGSIHVGIARVRDASLLGEDALDWSHVNYFAVGELSFVNLP